MQTTLGDTGVCPASTEEAAVMNANPEISQREPARHVRQIPLDHKMPNSCAFLACSSSCKLPLEDRGSFSGQ